MEFSEVVRTRRMTRSFLPVPVDRTLIEACLDLAARSPSAGRTHGWHVVALDGAETARYWDAAFPVSEREGFAFPGLFDAPFVGVVIADPQAYVERYSEADKARTGWGQGAEHWPVPYWTVDAAMATMTFLHALHEAGLGALFFAVAREDAVRASLEIPSDRLIIGAVAAGREAPSGPGRSASRPARRGAETVKWGGFT